MTAADGSEYFSLIQRELADVLSSLSTELRRRVLRVFLAVLHFGETIELPEAQRLSSGLIRDFMACQGSAEELKLHRLEELMLSILTANQRDFEKIRSLLLESAMNPVSDEMEPLQYGLGALATSSLDTVSFYCIKQASGIERFINTVEDSGEVRRNHQRVASVPSICSNKTLLGLISHSIGKFAEDFFLRSEHGLLQVSHTMTAVIGLYYAVGFEANVLPVTSAVQVLEMRRGDRRATVYVGEYVDILDDGSMIRVSVLPTVSAAVAA